MDSPPANNPMPADGVTIGDGSASPGQSPVPQTSTGEPIAPDFSPETIIVPAQTEKKRGIPPAQENQFIPQTTVPVSGPSSPPPPSQPGSTVVKQPFPFKKILIVIVLIVCILGVFIVVRNSINRKPVEQDVTISYWGLWEEELIISSIIADFELMYPHIKVQYTKHSPKQYRERLSAAIARGEGPDVFRFHNTWVPMLRDDLTIVPADIMTPDQFAVTFYPVAASSLMAGSSIYGIPLMIDGLGLYYNQDLFTAAGVTPPTTWVELLNMVPRLTAKTEDTIITSAIALGTTGNVEHFSDILAVMFLQNNASLVAPKGKEAEETLLFYRNFADPSNPYYTWNASMDNSIYAFATGKVAMILAPSWRAFEINAINPELKFAIAPIPQLPGKTVTWASYWVEGVSAQSAYQEQAWKFVQFLTQTETAVKLFTEESKTRLFGEPYARVALGSTIANDPYAGAYIQQAAAAMSFPLASRTFDNGINDKLIKYLEDAVNSVGTGNSPSAALETMNSGFKQVLGTYGLTSSAR